MARGFFLTKNSTFVTSLKSVVSLSSVSLPIPRKALQLRGFTVKQFAEVYSKKFGMNLEQLMNRLWGENFFIRKLCDVLVHYAAHSELDEIMKRTAESYFNGSPGSTSKLLPMCVEDFGFKGFFYFNVGCFAEGEK